MITDDGTIIRVQACEISKMGRDTQGVIIMRTDKGAVSTVAITPHEEESEEDFDEETMADGEENAEAAEGSAVSEESTASESAEEGETQE